MMGVAFVINGGVALAKSDLWCQHMILVFSYPSDPEAKKLSIEDLKWLAAFCDLNGKPQDFFFDGFLITGFGCPGGRHLLGAGKPAIKTDWDNAARSYTSAAVRVNDAFRLIRQAFNDSTRKAKIIIALPYPDPRITNLDSLDFSRHENRVVMVKWFVDELLKRWNELSAAGKLDVSSLVGFYWGREGASAPRTEHGTFNDTKLMKDVASYIHEKGYLFHWIPGFRSGCVFAKTPLIEVGFDCVTQQINYQNPQEPGRPLSIFDEMTEDVHKYKMHGVEMTPNVRETNLNPLIWSWQQVHLANLEAALRLDWKKFPSMTYFDGNSFLRIASDPKTHIYYAKLHKWVKGTLTAQDVNELCDAVITDLTSRGVLSAERLQQINEAKTVLEKLHLMEKPITSASSSQLPRPH